MGQDPKARDILELIDSLEAHIIEGRRFLMSNRVIVEEGEVLAILDQLRSAVPAELQLARRVLQDRQKVILDAQAEAEKIITTARDRAEYLISEQGVTAEARYRSEDYLRQARENARRSMSEVDSFAKNLLDQVEQVMRKNLNDIEQAKGSLSQPH
jgi:hypothetical protein